MRTAHHNTGTTKRVADAGDALSSVAFKWNHTDSSQFILIDPSVHGWSVAFVDATPSKAEHLRVTAPAFGGVSRAYLMVSAELDQAKLEMCLVHGFFGVQTPQYVYAIIKAVDVVTGVYVGAQWAQPSGVLTGVCNDSSGDLAVTSAEGVLAGVSTDGLIVATQLSLRGGLLGSGLGRVSTYGNIAPSVRSASVSSHPAGIGFSLTNPSRETIEIYDVAIIA